MAIGKAWMVPAVFLGLAMVPTPTRAQENWTQQLPTSSPSPRQGARMVYDPVHQQTVLFGGCAQSQNGACVAAAGQETWLWNGLNWSLGSTSGPSPRFLHSMAWDPIRQKIVLYGGNDINARVFDTDTWLWDGTSWTELSASITATPGVPSYMAYDASMNRMVLLIHGNYIYGVFVKPQTWFLNSSSTAWAQQFPAHPTFNLDGGGMVYDPVHEQIVLESTDMLSSGINRVSNTYVLAESTPDWIVQSPQHTPPPTWDGAYAWDGSSSRFIRFGGYNVTTTSPRDYSDTWAWDGTDWSLLTPANSPPARSYGAMAYDEARQEVVLFGGVDDAHSPVSQFGDTWTFQGATTTQVSINLPSGVNFNFNGQNYSGSQIFHVAPGSYTLSTASPQASGAGTQAVFTSWSDGGAEAHTVNVGASSVSITGTYVIQYLLTTSSNPSSGGTVTQSSVAGNGPYYTAGTLVLVFESPTAGYSFTGWNGACSGTGACLVTMNSPLTVTANFGRPTYLVSVNVPPGVQYSIGGFPFAGPGSIALQPGTYFLNLVSPQAAGTGTQERFVSWSDGGAQSHNLVVAASALTLTGTFTPQYLLTTVVTPAGSGSIVGSGFYDAGTPVAVLQVAAPGYVFEYFSGGCSGSTCLVFMNAPMTVTGNFSPPLTWIQLFPSSSPSTRTGSAMVWDVASQQAVLFGGGGAGTTPGDTWTFDGVNWSRRSPVASPAARSQHGMAYDALNSQVVLFGGNNGSALSDTWLWTGSNWIAKSPANSPAARFGCGMAYDAARSKTVLFGGGNGQGDQVFNDTWEWDGTNWTKMNPQHSPPGREFFAMAYDAARQTTVLFGGLTPTGGILADTWLWNGSDWIQQAPASSPSQRSGASMVYDSAHQQTLLFGGVASGESSADAETWVWDGTNWTERTAYISPSARFGHAMAFDPVHQQPVLFGGEDHNTNLQSDTWEWVAPTVNLVLNATYTITTPGSTFFEIGVTLVNQGNAPVTNLSITNATFGGVTAAAFEAPSLIPLIAPGAPAHFNIQFPISAIPAGRSASFVAQGTYSSAGIVNATWTDNIRSLHVQ